MNPICATGLFLYSLKILENQKFSDIFRKYRQSSWMKCVKKALLVKSSPKPGRDEMIIHK